MAEEGEGTTLPRTRILPLAQLEYKFTLRILFVLRASEKMYISRLIESLNIAPDVLHRRLVALMDMGLITEEREPARPNRRYIILTEKGRYVAGCVSDIMLTLGDPLCQ